MAGNCLSDRTRGQTGRASSRYALQALLLEEAAVFLHPAVPTAGFHANRPTRSAIGDAGRDRGTIGAFFAVDNARCYFATATHRSSDGGVAEEEREPHGSHDNRSS